jgi:transcriptional regulator GlxA family with amidase domain
LVDKKDWSVERVARAVGYATAYSFSRAFQAYFEMTPTEYRELVAKSRAD